MADRVKHAAEVVAAYDRWQEAASLHERRILREVFVGVRDAAGACGHEDAFGGPCVLPRNHRPGKLHDDGRKRL